MKKLKAILCVAMFFTAIFTLAGCSVGKPTVNLNDYISVSANGYDGYGTLEVSFDTEKLVEDHASQLSKNVDSSVFGSKTPAIAAEFAFDYYEPFALSFETGNSLRNGDKVSFGWNTSEGGIKQLQKILDVNFKYDSFTYNVEGLTPVREVNPFAHLKLDVWGLSGEGYISSSARAIVEREGEEPLFLSIRVDDSGNGTLKNGDSIHMQFDNVDPAFYVQNYGIQFTSTEADVVLDCLTYYEYNDPQIVFDCFGGESRQNAETAMKEHLQSSGVDAEAEYIGAFYCYQNEGNAFAKTFFSRNCDNQFAMFFRLTNSQNPDGWYTYLVPTNNVAIDFEEGEYHEKTAVKRLVLDTGHPFEDGSFYYEKEVYSPYRSYAYPITFEYGGRQYVGHRTMEDCVQAYRANELVNKDRLYDNIAADSALSGYIQ